MNSPTLGQYSGDFANQLAKSRLGISLAGLIDGTYARAWRATILNGLEQALHVRADESLTSVLWVLAVYVVRVSWPMGVALTVVVPVYNSASTLDKLVEALAGLHIDGGLEIVLVNDGSIDNSLHVCLDLCKSKKVPLTVVNLTRNFGEHNAIMAGLSHASGAYVVTMDDDLQNPPEEVVRLWRHAKDNDYDVVYSYYTAKRHSLWRNVGSRIANRCADLLLDKPKGLYLSSFRCISAPIVRVIVSHTGPFPFVDGLITQVTQNISQIEVAHLPRVQGKSNYNFRRLLRLFLSICLNFSVVPLRVATITGFIMTWAGLIGFVFVVVEAINSGQPKGWASLMASSLLLAGVQLAMLGFVGEYVGRMFLTMNGKPQFVIRNIEVNSGALQIRRDNQKL